MTPFKLISKSGDPTPEFLAMIEGTVTGWLKKYHSLPVKPEFFVVAVRSENRTTSYWGLIDMLTTPEEDLYIEFERRFYCAYRTLGEHTLVGMGIFDIDYITGRKDPFDDIT